MQTPTIQRHFWVYTKTMWQTTTLFLFGIGPHFKWSFGTLPMPKKIAVLLQGRHGGACNKIVSTLVMHLSMIYKSKITSLVLLRVFYKHAIIHQDKLGLKHSNKCWFVIQLGECMESINNINERYQRTVCGYQIVIPIKYLYLVGMSKWEIRCVSKLLLGSVTF